MLSTPNWADTQKAVAAAEEEFEAAKRQAEAEYHEKTTTVIEQLKLYIRELQDKCAPFRLEMEQKVAEAESARVEAIKKAYAELQNKEGSS